MAGKGKGTVFWEEQGAKVPQRQAGHTQTLAPAISTKEKCIPRQQAMGEWGLGGAGRKGWTPEPCREDPDVVDANAEVSSLGRNQHCGDSVQGPARIQGKNDFFLHE